MKPKAPIVEGEIPSPANQPPGCAFHTRCPLAFGLCDQQNPEAYWLDGDHFARCHLLAPDAASLGAKRPDRDLEAGECEMIRIGIDVGGTNTDAVVMDGTKVLRRRQGGDDAGRDVGRCRLR